MTDPERSGITMLTYPDIIERLKTAVPPTRSGLNGNGKPDWNKTAISEVTLPAQLVDVLGVGSVADCTVSGSDFNLTFTFKPHRRFGGQREAWLRVQSLGPQAAVNYEVYYIPPGGARHGDSRDQQWLAPPAFEDLLDVIAPVETADQSPSASD